MSEEQEDRFVKCAMFALVLLACGSVLMCLLPPSVWA